MLAPHVPQGVAHFAHRGICTDALDNRRHRVPAAARRLAQPLERPLNGVVIAGFLQLRKPRQLAPGRRVVDIENRNRIVVFLDEVVDPDDDFLPPTAC